MYCKMDVDDPFAFQKRRAACRCRVNPAPPIRGSGCLCPVCDSQCSACPGFGFVEEPERKFVEILRRVRSEISRRYRRSGRPPGFVRLTPSDVKVVRRKRGREDPDHPVYDLIDLGPPLRVFDVLVVVDRRRR